MRIALLLIGASLLAAPLAQAESKAGNGTSGPQKSSSVRALSALRLLGMAATARQAGVENEEVDDMLQAVQSDEVEADEASNALEVGAQTRKEGADTQKLGSFVREQVRSGVRGKQLAAALAVEKDRRVREKASPRGPGDGPSGARSEENGNGPGQRNTKPMHGDSDEGQGKSSSRRDAEKRKSGGASPSKADEKPSSGPRFDASKSDAEIQAEIEASRREADQRAADRAARRSGGDSKASTKAEPDTASPGKSGDASDSGGKSRQKGK